jgi:integrase
MSARSMPPLTGQWGSPPTRMTGQPENGLGKTGAKIVRKRLADGTVKEYRYDRRSKKAKRLKEHGAIRQLADIYAQSPEFLRLSKKWQIVKHYYLRLLEEELSYLSIQNLNDRKCRGEFYEMRDRFAVTPDKADKLLDTLKGMLNWAYERDKVQFNHALGIPHLAKSGKRRNDIIWTEDHEAMVYCSFPQSLVQCFRFALFSAMRQSDMCALKWSDYKDGWISYRQSKTGAIVNLPVYALPPFHELVEGLSRATDHMLTTETGHPMIVENLRVRWRDAFAKSPLAGADLHWHDLRGTATTRLLEASCTDAEVAAITGHSIGPGTKLGDYAARSKILAINAYQKWAAHIAEQPKILTFGNRDGNRQI